MDLAGKRIGLGLYTQSACVWMRGHLREHYGVERQPRVEDLFVPV